MKNKIENYIFNNENKVKINSKNIKKGDVFLALKGRNSHGNKFISESIKNGAIFCITDKKIGIPKKNNKICIVKNISKFLVTIANKKRKLFGGKVIGITGSAGKTTLKESLSFFLSYKYKVSTSYKSYNNFLGVIISMLNMNVKARFAIFELGTSNFGEIKKLVKYILPSQIIITNIQSTHLENFENKKNIAIEKSNIFLQRNNSRVKLLIISKETKEEELLFKIANQNRIKEIVTIGERNNNNYLIQNIKKINRKYLVKLLINNKSYLFYTNTNIIYRIKNIIFCLALFKYNRLNVNIIFDNLNKLKPVIGRGLIINKKINNIKIKFIDETYNANPETMKQSIHYFNFMNLQGYRKVLILGNMNELGNKTNELHLQVLKYVENYKFYRVILCGEFFKLAIRKVKDPINKYIIKNKQKELLEYVTSSLNNNTMILAKCSNSTDVNKFGIRFNNIEGGN